MGADSGPPGGSRIIQHGVDELLVQQDCVSNGEIIPRIQEGTQHTYLLNSFLSDLIDVRRSGESCI